MNIIPKTTEQLAFEFIVKYYRPKTFLGYWGALSTMYQNLPARIQQIDKDWPGVVFVK